MGQALDQLAFSLSVRKRGDKETGIEAVHLLQPTGKASIGAKSICDGSDQEIDGPGNENDGMAGLSMLFKLPHGGG
jgi:hypothetical protein